METDNNRFNEIVELKEFYDRLDGYLSSINAPDCIFDPAIDECMNLSHDEFISLSTQESHSYWYKLSQYLAFLHKQHNINSARMTWCEEILYKIIAKGYKNYPDYMKFDVRRHSIINEDTFAQKIDKIRLELFVRINSINNIIKDVSNMMSIFQKKAYEK